MRPFRAGSSCQSAGSICAKQRRGFLAASISLAVGFLAVGSGSQAPAPPASGAVEVLPVVTACGVPRVGEPVGVATVPAAGGLSPVPAAGVPVEVGERVEPPGVTAGVGVPAVEPSGEPVEFPAAAVPVGVPVPLSRPVEVSAGPAPVPASGLRCQSRCRSASKPASGVPALGAPGASAAGPAASGATVPAAASGLWACNPFFGVEPAAAGAASRSAVLSVLALAAVVMAAGFPFWFSRPCCGNA
ncbi:MAG TPA: hypothetical protein PLF81_00460 [Candidatus Anammoximicrobium sp.]|nr:hypothetical protein [Candidatus Anammoximicrobium sp.]